jgi:hypothetical protein
VFCNKCGKALQEEEYIDKSSIFIQMHDDPEYDNLFEYSGLFFLEYSDKKDNRILIDASNRTDREYDTIIFNEEEFFGIESNKKLFAETFAKQIAFLKKFLGEDSVHVKWGVVQSFD